MAVNRRHMPLPAEAVWRVVEDGRTYARWVVGTRAIREVDPHWPQVGARLHYTVGYGWLRKDDETHVLEWVPGRRLQLEAHGWPFGSVQVSMRIDTVADGCLVTMMEAPRAGPVRRFHNKAVEAFVYVRNRTTLRRLERLARATGGRR